MGPGDPRQPAQLGRRAKGHRQPELPAYAERERGARDDTGADLRRDPGRHLGTGGERVCGDGGRQRQDRLERGHQRPDGDPDAGERRDLRPNGDSELHGAGHEPGAGRRGGDERQQRRHRCAHDHRHAAGGSDADRGDRHHRGRQRAADDVPERLHLPVDQGGRRDRNGHLEGDPGYLQARSGGRGQADQGEGEFHRRPRLRRIAHQHRVPGARLSELGHRHRGRQIRLPHG